MIEQSHYLYRQYAADGTLLYIGVTMNPKSRLVAHIRRRHRAPGRTGRPAGLQPLG